MPDKQQFKGGRLYVGSWFGGEDGVAAGQEMAGHRASTVRRQREVNTGAQLASSPDLVFNVKGRPESFMYTRIDAILRPQSVWARDVVHQ